MEGEINYLLASLVSSLGVIAGTLLAFFTREELKPGRKHFEILQKALLVVILVVFLNYLSMPLFPRIIVYAIAIFLLFSFHISSTIFFAILAPVFYISSSNQQSFFAISSLIFLYCLVSGTLIVAYGQKIQGKEKLPKLPYLKKAAVGSLIFMATATLLKLLL